MTIKSRINHRVLNALMVILVFLASALYSATASAQTFASNTLKEVRYAENVNLNAKAVPINDFINSPYQELKPAVAPNGDRVYFSRMSHPENTRGVHDNEDIWYSEYNKADMTWTQPIRMGGELNNEGPNYINNVSVTGDTLILGNRYHKNGKMRAGLSYSVRRNGQWSTPVNIDIVNDYNISEHSQSHVSLKSGVIIRAIQRVETYGDRDLYVSFWNGNEATEPINMGGVINTEFEESSPFLAADNKTLYFASKGHNGHGGFDIYVTRRLDDSWTNWSVPENLGPAVNGPMDEEFFSLTHCGKFALFSKQVSVHNVDIYRIATDELFSLDPESPIDLSKDSALSSL